MECYKCGRIISEDFEFCPSCGEKTDSRPRCRCGEVIAEGSLFCARCGRRTDGKKACPACGATMEENHIFCAKCGYQAPLTTKSETTNNKQSHASHKGSVRDAGSVRDTVAAALDSRIARFIKTSALIACMLMIFISSFFTSFKVSIPDSYNGRTRYIEIKQSNVQIIDAMFHMNKGYTEKQLDKLMDRIEKETDKLEPGDYEGLSKLMSSVNLYKLAFTDPSIFDDELFMFIPSLGAAKFQVTIYGILALMQILGSLTFLILLVISLFSPRFLFADFGLFACLMLAIASALVVGGGTLISPGVAVLMPIIMCSIAIPLLIAFGLLKDNKEIQLKPLIRRAVSAVLALVLVLIFSFGSVNTLKVSYKNSSGRDVESTLPIKPYDYSAAYGFDKEMDDFVFGDLSYYFSYYLSSGSRSLIDSSQLFLALNDKEYYENREFAIFLYQASAVLYVIAILLFLWYFAAGLYMIANNKYWRHGPICALLGYFWVSIVLISGIVLMVTTNKTIKSLGIANLKVGMGAGIFIAMVFSLGLMVCTIVFRARDKSSELKNKQSL